MCRSHAQSSPGPGSPSTSCTAAHQEEKKILSSWNCGQMESRLPLTDCSTFTLWPVLFSTPRSSCVDQMGQARQALPHHAMSIKSVVPARVHFFLRQHVGHACSCRCASALEFERKFPTSSICRLASMPSSVQHWRRVESHELVVDDLPKVESRTTDVEHAKEETLTDPCNCKLTP